MSNTVGLLLEMGFSKKRAEEAVKETQDNGVEAAMEWLISHEESSAALSSTANTEVNSATTSASTNVESQGANSLKCEDCGKLFQSIELAELHATKTGHSNFSESSETVKPLTEEEKQAQLLRVNELLKQKRHEREEKEKQRQLETERNRRNMGKEISLAKQKHDELEMKKILDQRRRDKEDEKRSLQKVREQIEKDKRDREAKFGMATPNDKPAPALQAAPVITPTNYNETKLQIRMLDDNKLIESFKADELLAAVRLYVQQKSPSLSNMRFSFTAPHLRKMFNEDDMQTSLKALGLVPSAVLIVKKLT